LCHSGRTKKQGRRFLKTSRRHHQRFRCLICRHTWSLSKKTSGFISAHEKNICRASLERGSLRILGRRYGRSRTAVMKIIHRVTKEVKDSVWVAGQYPLQWSGILAVDGKSIRVYNQLAKKLDLSKLTLLERIYLHKKVWLCGIDYGTGDLPHYELADEETMIDLVLFFKQLKNINYPLRVLVSDGNEEIIRAARLVYGPGFYHQLCTRHFIEGLKRKSREAGLETDGPTSQLIHLIQQTIEAETLERAAEKLAQLKRQRGLYSRQRELLKMFYDHLNELTTHLQHLEMGIPHTTNDIENLFRQLNLRLKSLGIFGRYQYARDYLKTWAWWRRCTPFTDCKGGRKTRNGRFPLQIACRKKLVDIDFLSP